ncbi:uncharacterized protein FFNC_15725 [Fusarium fujikuroi]|nr:uncharacterized protein FFNC_15725 [Fusarium fujikuroi]
MGAPLTIDCHEG